MFYAPLNGLFSNDWWAFITSTYSVTVALIPVALTAIAKLAAILDPRIKSNEMTEWVQETFYKGKKSC